MREKEVKSSMIKNGRQIDWAQKHVEGRGEDNKWEYRNWNEMYFEVVLVLLWLR